MLNSKNIHNHNLPFTRGNSLSKVAEVLRPFVIRKQFKAFPSRDLTETVILSDERKEVKCFKREGSNGYDNRMILTTNQIVEEILQTNGHERGMPNKNEWYLADEDETSMNELAHIHALDLLWYMNEECLDSLSISDKRTTDKGLSRPLSKRFNKKIEKLKKDFKANIPSYEKEMDEIITYLKEKHGDEFTSLMKWTDAEYWADNDKNINIPKHLIKFLRFHARKIEEFYSLSKEDSFDPSECPNAKSSLMEIYETHEWSYSNIFVALGLENNIFSGNADIDALVMLDSNRDNHYGADSFPSLAKEIAPSKYKTSKALTVSKKNLINGEVLKYRQSAKGELFHGE